MMARAFDDYDPMTQRPKFPDIGSAKAAADKAAGGSNFGYNPADTLGKYQTPGTSASVTFPGPAAPAPEFPGEVPPPDSVVTPSVPAWAPQPEQTTEGQMQIHNDWVNNQKQGLDAVNGILTGEAGPSGPAAPPPAPTGPNGYVPPAYSYTPPVPNAGISPLADFAPRDYLPKYGAYKSNADDSPGTPVPKKSWNDLNPHTQEIETRRLERESSRPRWR